MLTSLDLFSGIGGFALGLAGIASPVAYCEIDPYATGVLNARMQEGTLPCAPVCPDVATVTAETMGDRRIDLITAGFPCQGFSLLGHRRGYDHSGSQLFCHVARLVGELQPALLLLENVPDIVHLGMDTIVRSLCVAHGYELRWMILGAHHVGAPHVRRRWFCLAVRPDDAAYALVRTVCDRLEAEEASPAYAWDTVKPPPVMTLVEGRVRRTRCAALGNAVVPDCVRHAFRTLLRRRSRARPWMPGSAATGKRRWPLHGTCIVRAGQVEVQQWKPELPVSPPLEMNLWFDPAVYRTGKPRSKLQTAVLLTLPVSARRWTTPRHGNVTAANVLTTRTLRDLPSQVRFERRTPDELRGGQISAEFVEYMMGYPIGWTSS
jgi:DNA (cytosine-5)-methyltransferase 1